MKRNFSSANNFIEVREERSEGQKVRGGSNKVKLVEAMWYIPNIECRILLRIKNMEFCLTERGTTITGIVLSTMIFYDFFEKLIWCVTKDWVRGRHKAWANTIAQLILQFVR